MIISDYCLQIFPVDLEEAHSKLEEDETKKNEVRGINTQEAIKKSTTKVVYPLK
jgi:hypothetical protein